MLSLAACGADEAPAPEGIGRPPGSESVEDPGGHDSDLRPLVDDEIVGPVLDYGPSIADLGGTACPVGDELPERFETLSLSEPREDDFELWIPANVCALRCVILRPDIGDHHIKDHGRPHLEHATRTLAERHACAVLTGDYAPPYHNASSRKSGQSTDKALTQLANLTGQPELATAPVVTLGFGGPPAQFAASYGAYAPQRVAAIAAWGSASLPASVPGLYLDGRRRLSGEFPGWHAERFAPARAEKALVAIAIDPYVGHNWGNTKKLGLHYLDALLALRLEPGAAAGTSAPRPLSLGEGVMVDNHSLELAPLSAETRSSAAYSWLPSEAFAELWAAFMVTGETRPRDADYPRHAPPQLEIPRPLEPMGMGNADAPMGTSTQGYAGDDVAEPAPPLTPRLLVATYAGGAGDQHIWEVGFDAQGRAFGEGEGFRVVYDLDDLDDLSGQLEGDPELEDPREFEAKTSPAGPPGNQLIDPRTDISYFVGYRQTGATEQTPFLRSSDGWTMWDHDDPLGDQRGMDVWLMPNGHIGFRGDSKAAHGGVFDFDPFDRAQPLLGGVFNDAWQRAAATSGSVALLIDPSVPELVSGSWMRSFSGFQAVDHWGRLYMATTEDDRYEPDNPFRLYHAGRAGLFVLDADLRTGRFNAALGGVCEDGEQALRKLAISGNILIAGGTTCAPQMATTANAVQREFGGGQDGMLFIIELFER